MEVQLYVYDLTKGMARSMSKSFLGIQIDAVYHTSLVFNNIEYFFGMGVQTCIPGATHHGAPMEIIKMGTTSLPLEVILEYLESLKEIYTPESYDLFAHNCNNFTHDFAQFLVGKGIPDHITSLPQTVLNTPFGQMLKPQIDASMRSITQAAVPPHAVPPRNGLASSTSKYKNGTLSTSSHPTSGNASKGAHGSVHNVTQVLVLDDLMKSATKSCAVVFFTSSTCAPCKIAYPTYDALAAENPTIPFIKVDINAAHAIGSQYQIRATPTFMTFLHGKKESEWTGANPSQLRGNVGLLIQEANPQHIHTKLRVPSLRSASLRPVIYSKIPPLDKLMVKMGSQAQNPSAQELKHFIEARTKDAKEAPIPDLTTCAPWLVRVTSVLGQESIFTAYDLLRCALLDPRVSGWFAEESAPRPSATLTALLTHVTTLMASEQCPYNLRLVALQLSSNLFTSPLMIKALFSEARGPQLTHLLVQLAAGSLLSEPDRPAIRAAAASLAFNLASANYLFRREEGREALGADSQTELAVALLEVLGLEDDGAGASTPAAKPTPMAAEGLQAALLAFGYLVYYCPTDGELWDLCAAMDAKGTVRKLKSRKEIQKIAVDVEECLPGSA